MQRSATYLHNAAMLLVNGRWTSLGLVPGRGHCCLVVQECGPNLWQLTALHSLLRPKVTTLAELLRQSALCT